MLTSPRTRSGSDGSMRRVDRLTSKAPKVERDEHRQQQPGNDGGLDPEISRRPEEINAVQKADEERRIAQRAQGAADIGDENDEKDNDVNVVAARNIGADQRPDQNHGRTRGTDDTRHCRTEREDRGIVPGRAPDVAADENAACDGVEGEQQHDEAQIFAQHRMHEGREHRLAAGKPRDRRQRRRGPGRGDLAVVGVPEFWEQQRPERDRQQQAGEGQCKRPRHGRAIERRRACSLREVTTSNAAVSARTVSFTARTPGTRTRQTPPCGPGRTGCWCGRCRR